MSTGCVPCTPFAVHRNKNKHRVIISRTFIITIIRDGNRAFSANKRASFERVNDRKASVRNDAISVRNDSRTNRFSNVPYFNISIRTICYLTSLRGVTSHPPKIVSQRVRIKIRAIKMHALRSPIERVTRIRSLNLNSSSPSVA